MSSRTCSSPPGVAAASALVVALGCGSAPVLAGTVAVTVVDTAGTPLPDAVALLEPTTGKAAVRPMADVEIAQVKRQFSPRVTLVTVGTRVSFPNFDTVRHHVYSFSPTKTFELKLYAGVPAAPIEFDKPGIAVLGCNIHDQMAAWVVVADTPWAAKAGANGVARIADVPAGSYRLRVWHSGLPAGAEPTSQPLTVGAGPLEPSVRLPFKAEP